MASSTLTTKGQITIPSKVRSALRLDAGSRVEFVEVEKGQYMLIPATSPVTALRGILRKPAVPVSIEDMNMAIIEEATKGSW